MADNFSWNINGLDRTLTALVNWPDDARRKIKAKYNTAAFATLADSDASVPVDTGILQVSGHIDTSDDDVTFTFEVAYGIDGVSTPKTYDYGYSTSKYSDGGVEADGYSWFQELGTQFMAAQSYLGSAFDTNADALLAALEGML